MVHSRRVTVARARPLASSSRAKDSISGGGRRARASDRARHQVVNWRRSRAQASRVRPRYPARNPARASRSGVGEGGLDRGERGGWGGSGHRAPPGRAGTGRLGQSRSQRSYGNPNQRKPSVRVTLCHQRESATARQGLGPACGATPVRSVPEAARLLRAGGRLVFHTTSILVALCSPEPSGPACRELLRPQRETYRLVTGEGGVQFHPGHREWITILRASGFTVDDLREIYAPPDAVDHPYYQLATVEWARQWPIEEIWVAHLAQ
jgi:hypothetical protein